MTKFENRTTTAHVVIVDFENLTNTREEVVEIPYTRTEATARKEAAKILGVEINRVNVKELIQKEWKALAPVAASVLVNISAHHGIETFEQAKELAFESDTVVPYESYIYYGTVFGYGFEKDENGLCNALAKRFEVEDITKRSKNDARAFLTDYAKDAFSSVFAVDYKQRRDVKRYAVVDAVEYQNARHDAAQGF